MNPAWRRSTPPSMPNGRRSAGRPNPITGQEKTTHLELMRALLDKGADPNLRLAKKLWFRSLTHDQHWISLTGATAFWRAAQSSDLPVMKLLVERGADPGISTLDGTTALMAAAGVGLGRKLPPQPARRLGGRRGLLPRGRHRRERRRPQQLHGRPRRRLPRRYRDGEAVRASTAPGST